MNAPLPQLHVSAGETIYRATFRALMEATLANTTVFLNFMGREMYIAPDTDIFRVRGTYFQTGGGPVAVELQTPENRLAALAERHTALEEYHERLEAEHFLWRRRIANHTRLKTLPPMDVIPKRWEDCQLYMGFDELYRVDALARFAQYRQTHEGCGWVKAVEWAFTKTDILNKRGSWSGTEKPFALQVLVYAWVHGPALQAALGANAS